MSQLKSCFRCNDKFPIDQLCTDGRLHHTVMQLYCLPCLIETLIEHVLICSKCGTRFVSHVPDKHTFLGRCASCRANNPGYISPHLARAKAVGNDATLTREEWKETAMYFNGLCAYCQIKPFDLLEHFIPISLGGGTTKSNCVPACHGCNRKKSNRHPDLVSSKFAPGAIVRVRNYLEQF